MITRLGFVGVLGLLAIAACAGTPPSQKSPEESGSSEVQTAPSSSSEPSGKASSVYGKLAPPPVSRALGTFWPTKICTRGGGMIVVSNSCVCDSNMTCIAKRGRGNTLDLRVVMNQEVCKDCGTFAALCNVPRDARNVKTLRITIDGKPALEALDLPRDGAPLNEHCYE